MLSIEKEKNPLESLSFSLSHTGCDLYAINILKVKEVLQKPHLVRVPTLPKTVLGIMNLRSSMVPVIDFQLALNMPSDPNDNLVIITEYNHKQYGLLVSHVHDIVQADWSDIRASEMHGENNSINSILVQDDHMILFPDIEKVICEVMGLGQKSQIKCQSDLSDKTVFYVDDSFVARQQIQHTLEQLKVKTISAHNGKKAWEQLDNMATSLQALDKPLSEHIHAILTDAEMPEMDGYTLTRKIRSDIRFQGIPVIMHSSLTGLVNQDKGKKAGANIYISKFEANLLAQTIEKAMS